MPTVNDASGTPLVVTDEGTLLAKVFSLPMEAHSAVDGDCYCFLHAIDPNVAGDIVYIKNDSDMLLHIYKIRAFTTGTGGLLTLKTSVTGTPTGGTAVVPVNALIGSGNEAEGTFNTNDGAQDMALTGGDTFDVLLLKGASELNEYCFTGEIALQKNQTFAIENSVDPTAVLYISVFFYYHEKIE